MAQGCGKSGGALLLVAKFLEALAQSELTGMGFFLRVGADRAGGSGETGALWSAVQKGQELDANQVSMHCLLLVRSD